MAFMVPDYYHGTMVRFEGPGREEFLIPEEDYEGEQNHGPQIGTEAGWFFKLTAPGYMDQTEWSGPYETEQEAREELESVYEVDADTGDELTEAE